MENGEGRRMLEDAVLAVGNVQISAQMAADALDTLNKLVVSGSNHCDYSTDGQTEDQRKNGDKQGDF